MAIPSVSPSKTGLQPSPGFIDSCWTVPFITAFMCLLVSIPQTNSGLLFVLFMNGYDVDRQTASWPRTIHTATTSLMGFALGAIQHRVSIHSTILAGALLCPVAIIASAFVPNMAWMSVTLGLLFGASYGAIVIETAVYVVSYFDEYRGFAMGMKFLGVSVSGMVGPSLLSYLASEHGPKGCFLIVGALALNLIPLAFMLRYSKPVRWSRCRQRRASGEAVRNVAATLYGATTQIQDPSGSSYTIQQPEFARDAALVMTNGEVGQSAHAIGTKNAVNIASKPSMCSATPSHKPLEQHSAPVGIIGQVIKVLRSPCFYVLLVAMVASDFTLPLFGSTIVDYAVDKGIALNAAAQLVTCQCLGGFIGRLIVPLITDKLAHSRCPITALSLAVLTLCFWVFPHVGSFAAVAVVSFVTGVQQGYLNTFKSVLVADYLGVHSIAASWGLMGVALLPLIFCEPSIVGAFRDTRGSYDNLYRMCGAVDLFAALMVSAQAFIDASKRRSNLQTCSST
ncbi:monocarboxylate transporter 9 [Dermacentor silvarum]|uniref:monocarboxylate transporter 9 n=1 Tax=Dermacentor silvarum TaxID=543639 RepID=UPI001898BA33|nr:monocarboxylate transporter 9 [Dermacentor silvarum]XP_049519541.1 monocarboxylate transporter 9 [Dermacentor silvarum]XP_049519542.1 monocarboxylate transporter 9 [Dermacentor silvarum]